VALPSICVVAVLPICTGDGTVSKALVNTMLDPLLLLLRVNSEEPARGERYDLEVSVFATHARSELIEGWDNRP